MPKQSFATYLASRPRLRGLINKVANITAPLGAALGLLNAARLYMYDEHGTIIPAPTARAWAKWHLEHRYAPAEKGTLVSKDVGVITVFEGIDKHDTGEGPPRVWYTLIHGGALDGQCERFATASEAFTAHQQFVKRARRALAQSGN